MNGPGELSTRSGPEPAYLIINADDYGYFKGVSRGILDCVRQGTVTATGVFANSPFLDEHASWLADQPDVDIGVHLNLTDRLPLTRPLSDALNTWGGQFPGKFSIAKAVLSRRIPVDLIRDEWRAQIEHCLARNLQLSFLNSHEHIHMLPPLYPIALALAREYGIEHVRFATPEWPRAWSASALLRDSIMSALTLMNRFHMAHAVPIFLGMGESGRLSQRYLSSRLPKLKPGKVYELMCHPGMADPGEVKGRRLLAYHDWELERQTLSDPELKKAFATNNIRLIGYRHLLTTREGLRVNPEEINT
ncbi:carbohydrate deacetylase [Candidatus Nitrotoga sp. 1052]|uniref:carbohydrate deacetylase n=1 Tax=Candidatus Nitrotoga sp. 1052 TaxID=2886964 RepID=UPI001EF475B9|nr:ChbG/HpnK family deacetylase [Candidatus Nitrotoga sp. 1052]CAH1087214.1 Cellobiose phosphotransferase system YdjC-like protein [Candidatus Nitrotoga sp. 1052]